MKADHFIAIPIETFEYPLKTVSGVIHSLRAITYAYLSIGVGYRKTIESRIEISNKKFRNVNDIFPNVYSHH